jgi:hypothetical protein
MNVSICFTSETTKQISVKFGMVLLQKLWMNFVSYYLFFIMLSEAQTIECSVI